MARAERQAKVLELRRDKRMSLRKIADSVGCGVETVRRDVSRYLAKLDAACLESAAAMRAELLATYDDVLQTLEREVLDNGNLDRVPDLLKTSGEIRKLYALDVVPLGRSEIAMRRAVITEIATKLRDQLAPETFAEVAVLLTDDEPTIQLLDGVAVAAADEAGTPPARQRRSRQGVAPSDREESWIAEPDVRGSDGLPVEVVVTNA